MGIDGPMSSSEDSASCGVAASFLLKGSVDSDSGIISIERGYLSIEQASKQIRPLE